MHNGNKITNIRDWRNLTVLREWYTPPEPTEKYLITFWRRVSDTYLIIYQETEYNYWDMPEYTWSTPTKPDEGWYSYTFIWWSPEIHSVTWHQVYLAQFEAVPIPTPGEDEILFSWENWTITHHISSGEIELNYTWSDSSITTRTMTIADRNVGASTYWTEGVDSSIYGDFYCWWATESWSGHAEEEDWGQQQSIAPSWYHIPTIDEWRILITLIWAITWASVLCSNMNSYCLMPYHWTQQNATWRYWSSSKAGYFPKCLKNENYYASSPYITDNYSSQTYFVRLFKDA